jgi:hypothetical protein
MSDSRVNQHDTDQQVPARDTTFDGVKPERIWIGVTNCNTPGRFQVVLEVNGIEKTIYDSINECDGNISHYSNVSWLARRPEGQHIGSNNE